MMKNNIVDKLRSGDDGVTTAEYAVCTVAGAGLGGVLITLLTSEPVKELLWTIFQQAVKFLL